MPYETVTEARESIPSLKNLSTDEVKSFIKIFNALVKDNMSEDKAIPLAISQSKKEGKVSKNLNSLDNIDEDVVVLENIEQIKSFINKSSLQTRKEMLDLLHNVEKNSNISNDISSDTSTLNVLKKSVNSEQRLALFVALPVLSEEDDEYDLHQDTYSAEEVRKAMLNYNEHCMKAGVYHLYETENAKVTQSYLAPIDFEIEDGNGESRLIKAGSWLQEWYFPKTEQGDKLWEKVKDGELTGISVQCSVSIEDIDE